MLGFPLVYCKGMRLMMFQLSSFYCTIVERGTQNHDMNGLQDLTPQWQYIWSLQERGFTLCDDCYSYYHGAYCEGFEVLHFSRLFDTFCAFASLVYGFLYQHFERYEVYVQRVKIAHQGFVRFFSCQQLYKKAFKLYGLRRLRFRDLGLQGFRVSNPGFRL